MVLKSLLLEKRDHLVDKWFDHIAGLYPNQTAIFLKNNRGQFSNPVGHSLKTGLDTILKEIANGFNEDNIKKSLDDIIRIRAIQDFTPSEAVSFLLFFKNIVYKELGNKIDYEEFKSFEEVMDKITLYAFDIYMKCREDLCNVRVKEVERRNFRLQQVANQLFELKGDEALAQIYKNSDIVSDIEKEKR